MNTKTKNEIDDLVNDILIQSNNKGEIIVRLSKILNIYNIKLYKFSKLKFPLIHKNTIFLPNNYDYFQLACCIAKYFNNNYNEKEVNYFARNLLIQENILKEQFIKYPDVINLESLSRLFGVKNNLIEKRLDELNIILI